MMGESGSLLEILGDILFGLAWIFGALLYPFFQIAALAFLRGAWWLAALLPLTFMIPTGLEMVDLFRQGASLAPIPYLMTAPYALAWLGAIAAASYHLRRRAAP
jgi:hypothetical protein